VMASCASSAKDKKPENVDDIVSGISDPEMQKRWKDAESKGDLPPVNVIPVPAVRVEKRKPMEIKEPQKEPKRPVISEKTKIDVQTYSKKPINSYKGSFRITNHDVGVLTGNLVQNEETFELMYKIPDQSAKISVPTGEDLQLQLLDQVNYSSLQRNIILYKKGGPAFLVYVAEGSDKPVNKKIDALNLTIEQQKGEGNTPVRIIFAGDSLILKQNQEGEIGEGEQTLNVYLMESIAIDPREAMLRQGQPYYVHIMLYKPE